MLLCVTGTVKLLLFMCYRDSKGVVVYVLQGQ